MGSRSLTGPIATSSRALTIGGDALYGQYFAGRIHEVRIYNLAVSAAEVQADMNAPVGSVTANPQPPTASKTSATSGSTSLRPA